MTMPLDPLGDRTGQPLSTNHILEGTLGSLPTQGVQNGAMAFATDARKDAEGGGSGTGIPVWYDESSATWRTYTTGAAAAT